ncbi:exosome non-catalytic core subunit rrp40 [Gurleya vavrai]
MNLKKEKIAFPGDSLITKTIPSFNEKSFIYGTLYSLQNAKTNFIISKSSRYVLQKDDMVIGKIILKMMDYYKVDIGNGNIAFLPVLNFPLANKRNKPDLNIGEYVMARVIRKGESSSILQCEENWNVKGFVFEIGCFNCKKLMIKNILNEVGKEFNFQIGIGMNGRIWIYNEDVKIVKDVINKIRMLI